MKSVLTEEQRATLGASLILKAIASEQTLCKNPKDDMYHRGRIAGLRSAYILLTGKSSHAVEPEPVPEPVEKEWDFRIRRSNKK